MPINFQQAVEQIRTMGSSARARHAALEELRQLARALLAEMAEQQEFLLEVAEEATRKNPHLRSALPAAGRLNAAIQPPAVAQPCVVLAADGSQINPDRHGPVEFGAINVGAILMRPGGAPRETVDSHLLFYEELYTGTTPLTEDVVALMRDLAEREMLFSLAQPERESGAPVVTLTDGPLELYGEDQRNPDFLKKLEDYLEVLRALARSGAAAAGYVDKPRSNYLINLLELVLLKRSGTLDKAGQEHPLFPVHDGDLFDNALQPGERSAIFALRSPSAARFKGELALHFFYLNVGRVGKPQVARVEIPHWVAEDADLLAQLHNVLLDQAKAMGARPYPYILHRAHEVAVVSFEEKHQLETMIQTELRKQGVEPGEGSNKQSSKDLPGRTRL